MSDLVTPFHVVTSVKNRTAMLESLTVRNEDPAQQGTKTLGNPPLIEVAKESTTNGAYNSTDSNILSKPLSAQNDSIRRHRRVDSTAFLQQSYLGDSPTVDLTDGAHQILKFQPDLEDLLAVLKYLQCGIDRKHDFNVRIPSAKASLITNVLVSTTIVEHWHHLRSRKLSDSDKQLKRFLVSCLTSVTGIGALLSQIKKLSTPSVNTAAKNPTLLDTISVLESILGHTVTVYDFVKGTLAATEKPTQRLVIWQELVSLLAGSKVLTVVSHVLRSYKADESIESSDSSWLGDGPKYCRWLARSIAHASTVLLVKEAEAWSMLAQITRRGFSLGNRDTFVADLYSSLLLGRKAEWTALHELLRALPRWEQKVFFDGMMKDVARNRIGSNMSSKNTDIPSTVRDPTVEAVAALVAGTIKNNEFLQQYIVEWLVDDSGTNASIGLRPRRAVIATLANHEEKLQDIISRCLELLSDKLRIQHVPILQQEATVQTLLLAVSYSNRINHDYTKIVTRSSVYLTAVSNRLGSSIERARYLGMIIGVALSKLVDEPGNAMNFGAEELETEQSKYLLDLANVQDSVGDHDMLKTIEVEKFQVSPATATHSKLKSDKQARQSQPTTKIISIEEIEESQSEDDDLVPYQKPDEDPSDSEEDPTLIDRSKPAAPVYIIDLIKNLNMNDKLDVVELALRTAPALIRRKTGFGTEVSENLDKLASSLLNLNNGVSKPQPQKLRLQALIACLVAVPDRMGSWLSSMYFEGDLSLVQRATLLTTGGLGCRELAGYGDDVSLATPQPKFPSKTLPEKFSAIYDPVNKITSELSRTTLQPMALAAADKLSGPDVLKVRTFSSRLEVQKRAAQKSKERSTRIPKNLHKVISESFFLPLCCRMNLLLSSRPQVRRFTIFEPHIFRLFLQTLTILMNILGPHAGQLNTVTRESLMLLTQLHTTPSLSLDPAILPSMLQLLLSMIDLNIEAGTVAEERLVTEFGQTFAELFAWIDGLKDFSIPIEEGAAMPWTAIAAGCKTKWQEVGRKFQGRMVVLMGVDMENFG